LFDELKDRAGRVRPGQCVCCDAEPVAAWWFPPPPAGKWPPAGAPEFAVPEGGIVFETCRICEELPELLMVAHLFRRLTALRPREAP
jgi:hypothetical protein